MKYESVTYLARKMALLSLLLALTQAVKAQARWEQVAVNGGLSLVATATTVWTLKSLVHDVRPDGSDARAFPSGHTAMAFACARIIDKELRPVSPWISVAGYSVAALTAIDRVDSKRHRWDDVLAGAAIGIGATELGYWLGGKIMGKSRKYALCVCGNQLYLAMRI